MLSQNCGQLCWLLLFVYNVLKKLQLEIQTRRLTLTHFHLLGRQVDGTALSCDRGIYCGNNFVMRKYEQTFFVSFVKANSWAQAALVATTSITSLEKEKKITTKTYRARAY